MSHNTLQQYTIPDWARYITIDGNGSVFAWSRDCEYDPEENEWLSKTGEGQTPGRCEKIGEINSRATSPQVVKTLKFVRET